MTEASQKSGSRRLHYVMIAILGIIIYSNTFNVPFIFDDLLYIVKTPVVTSLQYFTEPSKVWEVIQPDSLVGYTFNTRLIGFLTFALNYKLHGLNVIGYHVFNISIHIINSLLVYWLVVLFYKTPCFTAGNIKNKPGNILWFSNSIALFSALIFVAHPIQTQAVTYISQRFASLATMFYLLAIIMYIKFRIMQNVPSLTLPPRGGGLERDFSELRTHRFKSILWYLLSVVSAILAMKTKEIAFTLPFIIVMCEFVFFDGKLKKRILYLIPILLTALIIPVSLMDTNRPVDDLMAGVDEATRAKSPISRQDYLFTEFRVIVTYIRLIFFPINQNLDYDYSVFRSFFTPDVFLSFLFLLAILGSGFYIFYRSRNMAVARNSELRLISFGIFWFFITLSVESSIIPTQDVIFEHRMYLPSAGLFILLVTLVFYLLNRLEHKKSYIRKAVVPALVLITVALSVTVYLRNAVWQDDIALWKDVISKSPGKARAYHEIGVAYYNKGMIDESIWGFETAVKLSPNYVLAHSNLAAAYYKKGRFDDSIREIRLTMMFGNEKAESYCNIGAIYLKKGLPDKAVENLRHALILNPSYAPAYHNLGIAYESMGLKDEAMENFSKARILAPDKYPND